MKYVVELRQTKKALYTCDSLNSAENLIKYLEIKDCINQTYKEEKYQIKQVKKTV